MRFILATKYKIFSLNPHIFHFGLVGQTDFLRIVKFFLLYILEEQVDDLQGQIRKLTEHVMELKLENEELKSRVSMPAPHNIMSLENTNSEQRASEIANNQNNYQV